MILRRTIAALCLLPLGTSPAPGVGDVRDAILRGNEHFAKGEFEAALAAYEEVADAPDECASELRHNRAAALFKLGRFADARELWVRAATMKDAAFEARARYNLGNCDYADALRALESGDAQAALDRLDVATQQYRDAIRLAPSLTDARANLELAQRLIAQIRENATTQPQSQQQPSSQPQQNEPQPSESDTPSSQPSSPPQHPSTSPATHAQADADQQPSESDQSSEQRQPETQPAEAAASQPSEPDRTPQAEQELELTRDQAERLLQKIRDLERARREMLMRREAAKYQPVDRDW